MCADRIQKVGLAVGRIFFPLKSDQPSVGEYRAFKAYATIKAKLYPLPHFPFGVDPPNPNGLGSGAPPSELQAICHFLRNSGSSDSYKGQKYISGVVYTCRREQD